MTLLCTYHHTLLHQGAFSIVNEGDETRRFVSADGRTIPRHGYRREDFVDDDVCPEASGDPSAEGFCTTTGQRDFEPAEVREPVAIYRLRRATTT